MTVRLISVTETCKSCASVPIAGKYMLADNGDSRPIKDMVNTMSFFCVFVSVENGGWRVGLVRSVLAAFSTSISGLLVVVLLLGCVSVVVEARVALACCIMVSEIRRNHTRLRVRN